MIYFVISHNETVIHNKIGSMHLYNNLREENWPYLDFQKQVLLFTQKMCYNVLNIRHENSKSTEKHKM